MTRDEIFATMRSLVADSLAVPASDVALESRLIPDLGADSLDFIDMVFLLEKRFGIKVREGDLDFFSRLDFSSPAVMREGFLTTETVERLRDWLPGLRDADPARVTPRQIFSMITVETLVILVEKKLAVRAGA
jgi:acyl carrier protein